MRLIKRRTRPADTRRVNDATTLVPPLRLGRLLSEARASVGLTIDDIAERSGGLLATDQLERAEAGTLPLDDHLIESLIGAYAVELGELVPERAQLIIDLDEGHIAVADGVADLDQPNSPDHVLARYLGLVYALRELPAGSPIALRDVDVSVLGAALGLHDSEVERRLRDLIDTGLPEVNRLASMFRHRLLIPMAGVVLGATAVGTLLLVRNDNSPVPATTTTIELGGPTVIERPGAPVVTTDAAATDPAAEVELAPAQSVERDPSSPLVTTAPVATPGTIVFETSEGPVELIEAATIDR